MLRGETAKRGLIKSETVRPSEKTVGGESGDTPALGIEAGIRHAQDERARAPQNATRFGEANARSGELLEAIPDEDGVERCAREAAALERSAWTSAATPPAFRGPLDSTSVPTASQPHSREAARKPPT